MHLYFIGNLEKKIGRNCNFDNTIGNRLIYFSLKIIICRNCPNGKIGYGICELGQVYPSGKAHFLLITNNTHFQLIHYKYYEQSYLLLGKEKNRK